jgi:hypothetical protein
VTEQLLQQQLESPSGTGRVEPRSDRQPHTPRHQRTGCQPANPILTGRSGPPGSAYGVHMERTTVEEIFDELRAQLPSVVIERIQVKWPADDDSVWFVRSDAPGSVQVDTCPGGYAPFLIEGGEPNQRRETSDVHEAVGLILDWLRDWQ